MAVDYVSTDTDLMAGDYITEQDHLQLAPEEWKQNPGAAGPWTPRHKRAWTEIKLHLLARPDPIQESDLNDVYEYRHAACLWACYHAFRMAGFTAKAEEFHAEYLAAMNFRPELTSGEQAVAWGYSISCKRGS